MAIELTRVEEFALIRFNRPVMLSRLNWFSCRWAVQ